MHKINNSTALAGLEMTANGLRIHFKSGKAYDYPDLSEADLVAIRDAESPGGHFSANYARTATGHLVEDDSINVDTD